MLYVLEVVAHELADPRAAVDVRDDLQEEVRLLHRRENVARSAGRCL